jgi:serine/threonine-protein kinase
MILAGQLATPASLQRFQTEAEAAARLEHPHIVPIYEIGQYDGQHYFSMKLIEGGTLAERVPLPEFPAPNEPCLTAPRPAFDFRHSAFVISQVARAIHYAHQRGILHRDLKPTNILLDERGEPHVSDFGLAKLIESDAGLSKSGAVLGTPSYMAPEQAAGRISELTIAADIYSLGAIFYELLAGQPPFVADTPLEVMRKVVEEEPVPPSSILEAPS